MVLVTFDGNLSLVWTEQSLRQRLIIVKKSLLDYLFLNYVPCFFSSFLSFSLGKF